MASSGLHISSMLLLSLLVISSATDYGYSTPTPPQLEKPKPLDKFFPSKSDCQGSKKDEEKEKFLPKKSEYEEPKYEKKEEHVPPAKPDYEVKPVYNDTKPEGQDKKFLPNKKPRYGSEPKPGDEKEKYVPKKPYNKEPKPAELPTNFDVQGLVLCKSGASYFPLQGAVANISCVAVDEEGNKIKRVFSKLSGVSDEKGYFFVKVCAPNEDQHWKLVIKQCNVFIDRVHSKLLDSTCNIPTDVNKGITGALLNVVSNYRILQLHDQKINLYSVGPFFYTTTTTTSHPKPEVPAIPHY
ncbi:hypothetical protein FNV43_RR23575 [Rhamnella rubrinervis]|uniref:Uncharacterized protein n=1 Tax=Rhamnella rubrinervis TaxID=2594499 RepID=A0A8K0GTI0_9ROSA|nr:hypothetical protein FNV43_RR23575 [Rhamnella rubrinervis]